MATRRPLVRYADTGSVEELRAADDLPVAVSAVNAVLTATQANSTVSPIVITGHTFTIPPGKTLAIRGMGAFTAAATTTGCAIGIRVAQPSGANGSAQGAWNAEVGLASTAAATGVRLGGVFNVSAAGSAFGETLGTASTAGNNPFVYDAVVKNQSTNVTTTVTVEFRSEVTTSAVTLQIGSACSGRVS
jgi:hypothetical protein